MKTLEKVVMSANLVLTTIDDSARRMFEVSNDRLGAVVGHKCVYAFLHLSSSHIQVELLTDDGAVKVRCRCTTDYESDDEHRAERCTCLC